MTVPRDTAKYGRPGIVSPELLAQHGAETGAYAAIAPPTGAILTYHRGLAGRLLATRPATTIAGFFGDTHLLESTDGRVALVSDFGIGAPVTAVMIEDLAALGCRSFVSVGTCGAMDTSLAVGDLILIERAVRDDGTSHHYLPADQPAVPDAELTASLAGELDARGIAFRRGASWTTDGLYRETAEEVRAHVADGVGVVEMEAAATFAVGTVRSLAVASLLVVSDVIDTLDGTWLPQLHDEIVGTQLAHAFDVAVATLNARV